MRRLCERLKESHRSMADLFCGGKTFLLPQKDLFIAGLDKPETILYNKSKFYRMKSEEQRQVAVTTVVQRARHWWEPAHAMAVNGFVRSAEKGFSRYLPPRPRVTAEGYSCVNAAYLFLELRRSFAVYLF